MDDPITCRSLKRILNESERLDLRKYLRVLPTMIEWIDAPGTERFDVECKYNHLGRLHKLEDEITRNLSIYALRSGSGVLKITADILKHYEDKYIPHSKKRKRDDELEKLTYQEMMCLGMRRIRNKTDEEKKDFKDFLRYLK